MDFEWKTTRFALWHASVRTTNPAATAKRMSSFVCPVNGIAFEWRWFINPQHAGLNESALNYLYYCYWLHTIATSPYVLFFRILLLQNFWKSPVKFAFIAMGNDQPLLSLLLSSLLLLLFLFFFFLFFCAAGFSVFHSLKKKGVGQNSKIFRTRHCKRKWVSVFHIHNLIKQTL